MNYRVCGIALFLCCMVLFSTAYAAQKQEQRDEQLVAFNFVDVDLPVITKFISEITKKNFIFDDKVKGKITIITPSKLHIQDAYNLFVSVLELKGYTVVPAGADAYKIVPSSEAKQKGIRIVHDKQPVGDSYIARLLKLNYISSEDAVRLIQPIISKDGYLASFGPGNMLLVIDSGLNIEKMLSILDTIDQPHKMEAPEIFFLKYASADAVAKIINEGIVKGRARAPSAPIGQQGEVKAVADQRLNAIILFGDRGTREAVRSLIPLLDGTAPDAQGRINVYFLENADAVELAKVLEETVKRIQTLKQAVAGAQAQVTPFETTGGIAITPDRSTNSLVIMASPADYQSLLQVIKQLDKRRRQVFVEAMIVEASMDKLQELGAKWRAVARHNGEPVVIGGIGTIDTTAVQGIINGLAGATLGGLGNFLNVPITRSDGTTSNITVPGFAALFNLSDFKDAVNVLSTPQILTSDNKEAEIIVAENVPFVSKRESDPSRTLSVFTTIERKDVGIILKITPQITEGDHVKLDIYQEMSALKQVSETLLITVGPITTKRSTRTSIVVRDEQTVVIGGLMQDRDEDTETSVPGISKIPILGWLFKSKEQSKMKTNLFVFITPHIIKEPNRLTSLTQDKQKEFARSSSMYADGELLVTVKEGTTADQALALFSQKGASILGVMDDRRTYRIKVKANQSCEDMIKELSAVPEVLHAEPNYQLKVK